MLGGVEPVMFVAWMAPERLRTDVFRDGECFLSVSVSDGIVREYRPSVQGRPLIEYDAPGPYGVPDTVFRGEYDCLIGSYTHTWVGIPDEAQFVMTPAPKRFAMWVRDAARQSDVVRDGRTQHMFVLEGKYEGAPVQTLYVDAEDRLVTQWDTVYDGVHRTRKYVYADVSADDRAVEEIDWEVRREGDLKPVQPHLSWRILPQ